MPLVIQPPALISELKTARPTHRTNVWWHKMQISLDKGVTWLRIKRHGLTKYLRVFSHTTPRERLTLYQLVTFLPSGANVLEIGSYLGSSALFICAGLEQGGGHLYCVDTWMNETMEDGVKDIFAPFKRNTSEFSSMITPIRKSSSDLRSEDVGCTIDFAFIDGDHTEEQVRSDFHVVSELLKRGGLLAFHDVSSDYPGVGIVLGEALASGKWLLLGMVDSLGWVKKLQ